MTVPTLVDRDEWAPQQDGYALGHVGGSIGMIVAGPAPSAGPERLEDFLARWGQPPTAGPVEVMASLRSSGLQGRGGGGFPLWRKVQAAVDAPGLPILIVNCSESEPASRKDFTICSLRPQLMLEGAAHLARAVGVHEVIIHQHEGSAKATTALRDALRQRAESIVDDPVWRPSSGPDGYVAGEASAVARFLHAGVALPVFSAVPMAERGPSGRPTLVCNAETAAHVAAIMRVGAGTWRLAGTVSCPGPQLVTLTGGVEAPGSVVEVIGGATIGEILSDAGVPGPPAAVLIGGYAGTWVRGDVAWHTPMEPTALSCLGAARGCGLLGVLPHGACGLMETARLAAFLAGESAGQCGPCVHGLPVLAECMIRLASGVAGRRTMRLLRRTAAALPGSGACAHPDGVARLVHSALDAFDDDVIRHRAGSPCRSSHHPPLFPVPVAAR